MSTLSARSLVFFLCLLGHGAVSQALQFGGVYEVGAIKRGKEYSVVWSGGSTDQQASIVLLNRKEEVVQTWERLQNDGQQTIKIKSGLRPGSGYVLKVQLAGEDSETASSSVIKIKRRIPLALTVSTLAIIPIVIVLLDEPDYTEDEIPGVPTTL